jgi:hypothetical protein
MICAIYARKSSAQIGRDEEDLSVTRQIDLARRFAEAKGWIVSDEHVYADDGISGAEVATKLRAKQRMLAVIQSGAAPFQVIVMQSNDRLSRRDGDEALHELKSITRAGIAVFFYRPTNSGRQTSRHALRCSKSRPRRLPRRSSAPARRVCGRLAEAAAGACSTGAADPTPPREGAADVHAARRRPLQFRGDWNGAAVADRGNT